MTTSAMRYEVCTQGISSALADSPAWISASEAETIWMSRIAMNMPKTMARKAKTRRAVSGCARAGGAGTSRWGGVRDCAGDASKVVEAAFAMMVPRLVRLVRTLKVEGS